jgi:hypothetical protein
MTRSPAGSDELRRAVRFRACCRVEVCQPYAVWTAITEELSLRGCRLLTEQVPRLGATLAMTLSTDLFGDDLETVGEVVWSDSGRLGVRFRERASRARAGAPSAAEWVARVLASGRSPGAAADVVPAIVDAAPRSEGNVVAIGEARSPAPVRAGAGDPLDRASRARRARARPSPSRP